ncbi:hypothetical protein BDR07DRAFT_1378216 [Suillus spraguei]|nr:hypothetical protein BDR07DRAFT_1378216 [Suillus spraguei]
MLLRQNIITDNLNIIVPRGENVGFTLYGFVVDDLGYCHVDEHVPIHDALEGVVVSFTKFKCRNMFITVSEATSHGIIFTVITSSPTTTDMVIMTAGGLAVFYPEWTMDGIVVTNHTVISSTYTYNKNIGCGKDACWQIQSNTNFMGKPCAEFCPMLWHKVADSGEKILVIEWDERFPLKMLLQQSNIMCMCMHNSKINMQSVHLPTNPLPQDYENICNQETVIQNHKPTYLGKQQGVLYATNAQEAHVVMVPWHNGKTYNMHLGSREQVTLIMGITRNYMDVTGNVLVVKHVRGNKHAIVDCTKDDIMYITDIMKRGISQDEFWT